MKNTKLITNVMVLAAAALLLISVTGCDHRYSINFRNDYYSPPVRQETHYVAPKVVVTDRRDDRKDRDDKVVIRNTDNRDRDDRTAVRTDNTRTTAVSNRNDDRIIARTDNTRTTAVADSRDKDNRTTVRKDDTRTAAANNKKDDRNNRDNKRNDDRRR